MYLDSTSALVKGSKSIMRNTIKVQKAFPDSIQKSEEKVDTQMKYLIKTEIIKLHHNLFIHSLRCFRNEDLGERVSRCLGLLLNVQIIGNIQRLWIFNSGILEVSVQMICTLVQKSLWYFHSKNLRRYFYFEQKIVSNFFLVTRELDKDFKRPINFKDSLGIIPPPLPVAQIIKNR